MTGPQNTQSWASYVLSPFAAVGKKVASTGVNLGIKAVKYVGSGLVSQGCKLVADPTIMSKIPFLSSAVEFLKKESTLLANYIELVGDRGAQTKELTTTIEKFKTEQIEKSDLLSKLQKWRGPRERFIEDRYKTLLDLFEKQLKGESSSDDAAAQAPLEVSDFNAIIEITKNVETEMHLRIRSSQLLVSCYKLIQTGGAIQQKRELVKSLIEFLETQGTFQKVHAPVIEPIRTLLESDTKGENLPEAVARLSALAKEAKLSLAGLQSVNAGTIKIDWLFDALQLFVGSAPLPTEYKVPDVDDALLEQQIQDVNLDAMAKSGSSSETSSTKERTRQSMTATIKSQIREFLIFKTAQKTIEGVYSQLKKPAPNVHAMLSTAYTMSGDPQNSDFHNQLINNIKKVFAEHVSENKESLWFHQRKIAQFSMHLALNAIKPILFGATPGSRFKGQMNVETITDKLFDAVGKSLDEQNPQMPGGFSEKLLGDISRLFSRLLTGIDMIGQEESHAQGAIFDEAAEAAMGEEIVHAEEFNFQTRKLDARKGNHVADLNGIERNVYRQFTSEALKAFPIETYFASTAWEIIAKQADRVSASSIPKAMLHYTLVALFNAIGFVVYLFLAPIQFVTNKILKHIVTKVVREQAAKLTQEQIQFMAQGNYKDGLVLQIANSILLTIKESVKNLGTEEMEGSGAATATQPNLHTTKHLPEIFKTLLTAANRVDGAVNRTDVATKKAQAKIPMQDSTMKAMVPLLESAVGPIIDPSSGLTEEQDLLSFLLNKANPVIAKALEEYMTKDRLLQQTETFLDSQLAQFHDGVAPESITYDSVIKLGQEVMQLSLEKGLEVSMPTTPRVVAEQFSDYVLLAKADTVRTLRSLKKPQNFDEFLKQVHAVRDLKERREEAWTTMKKKLEQISSLDSSFKEEGEKLNQVIEAQIKLHLDPLEKLLADWNAFQQVGNRAQAAYQSAGDDDLKIAEAFEQNEDALKDIMYIKHIQTELKSEINKEKTYLDDLKSRRAIEQLLSMLIRKKGAVKFADTDPLLNSIHDEKLREEIRAILLKGISQLPFNLTAIPPMISALVNKKFDVPSNSSKFSEINKKLVKSFNNINDAYIRQAEKLFDTPDDQMAKPVKMFIPKVIAPVDWEGGKNVITSKISKSFETLLLANSNRILNLFLKDWVIRGAIPLAMIEGKNLLESSEPSAAAPTVVVSTAPKPTVVSPTPPTSKLETAIKVGTIGFNAFQAFRSLFGK